jgi:hypothetical protein
MEVRDRLKRSPRERLAERVAAASYGTVLILSALALIDVDAVTSGLGWELVTGVGAATYIAHIFAEVVGDHVRHQSPLDREAMRRAMSDGLPIVFAAVAPAAMLLLGRLEVLEPRTALWASMVVAIVQLVALGAFVGAAVSSQRSSVWRYAAVTAAVGFAVVVIKLMLSH